MSAKDSSEKRQHVKPPRYTKLQIQLKNAFSCVVAEKCSNRATLRYGLLDNLVSVSIPRQTSYYAQLEIVAAAATVPISIDSLSPGLSERGKFLRGNTVPIGQAADFIDRVASDCDLRWWITEKGLVMAYWEPTSDLPDFNTTAGRLMVKYSQGDRLKEGDLEIIAKALDDEHSFSLKECLQPSYWKKLDGQNQLFPKKAVKTFLGATRNRPVGRRAVQKALYYARDKFLESQP